MRLALFKDEIIINNVWKDCLQVAAIATTWEREREREIRVHHNIIFHDVTVKANTLCDYINGSYIVRLIYTVNKYWTLNPPKIMFF